MKILYAGLIYESIDTDFKLISKSYSECSPEEISSFKQLLIAGNEVVSSSIDSGLRSTIKLVFAYIGDILVGVSAIKLPTKEYIEGIFNKAGVGKYAKEYEYEFGYSYVVPEYRLKGIADAMLKERLKFVSKAYSTTRVNNIASVRNLTNNGFSVLGNPYKSFRGDYYLQLMVY